jgi:hypothetical protein
MSVDWKRMLTSRKFWAAVIEFITPLMVAFNMPENAIAQVVAIIMSGAGLIAYILAEGWVDANHT